MWWIIESNIIFYIHSLEAQNNIVIYNDQGTAFCDAKTNPNDIFVSGNIIVTVGKDIIEFFEFSQVNEKNKLEKKYELNINNNNNNTNTDNFNNNNFNNNNNLNNDNEILSIVLANKFIFCGHSSGLMSIWQTEPNVYLKKIQAQKMHDGPINKILYTQLSDNMNYVISCSSDKKIKVYCMESNNIVIEKNFESEVMDIQLVKDFDKTYLKFQVVLKHKQLDMLFLLLTLLMLLLMIIAIIW